MLRNLNDKIPGADNFYYWEFTKSDIALRLGIDNIPKYEQQWVNIESLAVNILQPIRNKFGRIRVTSGYRVAELCKAINLLNPINSHKKFSVAEVLKTLLKKELSNHTRAEAADIEPMEEGVTLLDIFEFVCSELDFREAIAEFFPSGWCHFAYRNGGNDKIIKLKDKDHNYDRVSLTYIQDIYS